MNKKALSILLAGATAASVVVASTASVSAVYESFDPTDATYGVVGDLTGWGADPDIALTDEDADGLYTATVTVPETGSSYKVRANSDWSYSWGALDDNGVTANSQTNCSFDESLWGTEVTVYFDTRSGLGGVDTWYVGTDEPEVPDIPDVPSTPESSEESVPEVPAGKYAAAYAAAAEQLGEDNLSKYYFFDNSETQWNTIGAYWWTPAENAPWPGAEAVKIGDTDIWAIEYDAATTQIIFNNLVSDADYSVENPKAQTVDTMVDSATNAGNVFVPDMETLESSEEGAVLKVKGNWVVFDASGEPSIVEDPSQEESKPAPSTTESTKPTTPNTNTSTGKGVNTGDAAPIALAAVFAAAALTAVVLTKKKVSSK